MVPRWGRAGDAWRAYADRSADGLAGRSGLREGVSVRERGPFPEIPLIPTGGVTLATGRISDLC